MSSVLGGGGAPPPRCGRRRATMAGPMEARTCYRHSNRVTGASCTRCGRPICPDCMVAAPVGHHCPECVREGNKGVRKIRPTSSDALVTKLLIAANVLVYLLQQGNPAITRDYGMSPQ